MKREVEFEMNKSWREFEKYLLENPLVWTSIQTVLLPFGTTGFIWLLS